MKKIIIIGLSLLFLISFSTCEKDDNVIGEDNRTLVHPPINPTEQPDELNNALIIFGELKQGNLPNPVNPAEVNISVTVSSASITSGNILFLPLGFSTITCLEGLYLQINGADHYWDIPIELADAEDNSVVIGITVPFFVQQGSFNASYMLYDCNGNIGTSRTIFVDIVPTENRCGNGLGFPTVSGSDGITVRTYDFGDVAGTVKISYEMYTLRDRMDIRYNDEWVESTADEVLQEGQAPPIKNCDEVTILDGFVNGEDDFEIEYDPNISREVSIYVSGCLNAGTEWYFNVVCPDGTTIIDNGSVCNNGTTQDVYDESDPDYHFYPTEGNDLTTIICDPELDANCTVNRVFSAMLTQSAFAAPTNDTLPVTNCKVTWVNLVTGTNPTLFQINNPARSITNYTMANYPDEYGFARTHLLHPSKVVRSVREVDGKIVISTEGEGTGKMGGLSENPYSSKLVWGAVDEKLKDFWEAQ